MICTICDDSFAPGCVALFNSLCRSGFRGEFLVGLVGGGEKLRSVLQEQSPKGVECHFRDLPRVSNVNYYKPSLLRICCDEFDAERFFFFDSDVVCATDWDDFISWLECGVAVCSDVSHFAMPPSHPMRGTWRRLIADRGLVAREFTGYVNGGFLG